MSRSSSNEETFPDFIPLWHRPVAVIVLVHCICVKSVCLVFSWTYTWRNTPGSCRRMKCIYSWNCILIFLSPWRRGIHEIYCKDPACSVCIKYYNVLTNIILSDLNWYSTLCFSYPLTIQLYNLHHKAAITCRKPQTEVWQQNMRCTQSSSVPKPWHTVSVIISISPFPLLGF